MVEVLLQTFASFENFVFEVGKNLHSFHITFELVENLKINLFPKDNISNYYT